MVFFAISALCVAGALFASAQFIPAALMFLCVCVLVAAQVIADAIKERR